MKIYKKNGKINLWVLLLSMAMVCEGATAVILAAIMAVIAAASSYMGIRANNNAVEAQEEAAAVNMKSDLQQLVEKRTETDEKAAQLKLQRQLQAARERGRVTAAQSDAGIQGNSTLKALNTVLTQESMDLSTIEANRTSAERQIRAETDAVYQGGRANLQAISTQAIGSGLGAMKILGGALEGGAEGYLYGKKIDGKKG